MMSGSYHYDPVNIKPYGVDRMRFELGDTMVEGREQTCALCDEEYSAMIPEKVRSERQWKKAKLACMESIFRRFSYETDTKAGPLSLSFGDRAALWKQEYEELKRELDKTSACSGAILENAGSAGGWSQPYFYNGMMSMEESEGRDI